MSTAVDALPRQTRWVLWSLVPIFAAIIAYGLWLRLTVDGPTPIDQSWMELVGLPRGTVLHGVAVILAEVGSGTGAAICAAVIIVAFVVTGRFRAAGTVATTMAAGVIASEGIKLLVLRARPEEQLHTSVGFSYPSGHAMGAAALATAVALLSAQSHRRRGAGACSPQEPDSPSLTPRHIGGHWAMVPAAAWILAMMWSRTALQVHWLTDTVAGALLGICVAVAVNEVWTSAALRRARALTSDERPNPSDG